LRYLLLIFPTFLLSSSIQLQTWKEGETFLGFLESEKLPFSLYYDADDDDKKLTEDIYSGVTYYVLKDLNGTSRQILIPVGDEIQIHIYRYKEKYFLEAIPIEYQQVEEQFVTKILEESLYENVKSATQSHSFAQFVVKALEPRINFRTDIHRGSMLSVLYKRNYRLGTPFGGVNLKMAMLKSGNREMFVIKHFGRLYNFQGEVLKDSGLTSPIKKGKFRISSRFTNKRWHPILRKYRAHLGIDLAARTGTPIYSSGDGTVVFVGTTRGYGNLVKVWHTDGYMTLYAHMNRYMSHLRFGSRVKKGEQIGTVGSTGLSTGPHLHFGLYKDGKAINPENLVTIEFKEKISKNEWYGFKEKRDRLKEQVETLITDYKSGRILVAKYEPIKLKCETTITNIASADSSNYIDFIPEERSALKFTSSDSDSLELSEEYWE
jgi:murein DD-endopeptidase MepM/ murein hydrolase activator NlpD